jgi:hypothetical protein
MKHTNKVEIDYIDKKYRQGRLIVNEEYIAINFVSVLQENFTCKDEYSAVLANDWNMSNPLTFQAKTVKGLVGKIKRHRYNLVKY